MPLSWAKIFSPTMACFRRESKSELVFEIAGELGNWCGIVLFESLHATKKKGENLFKLGISCTLTYAP